MSLFGQFIKQLEDDGAKNNPVRKRYWLFAGNVYYPKGGMGDFIGQFDDLNSAHAEAEVQVTKLGSARWAHILDSYTGEVAQVQEKAVPASGPAGPKVRPGAYGWAVWEPEYERFHGSKPPRDEVRALKAQMPRVKKGSVREK